MAALSQAAARYQNALLYAPGMGVGRYPERSAATLPTLNVTTPQPTQYQAPQPYVQAPVSMGYGNTDPLAFSSSVDSGSGSAGPGLGILAGPLTNALLKAIQEATKPEDGGKKKPEVADPESELGGDVKLGGTSGVVSNSLLSSIAGLAGATPRPVPVVASDPVPGYSQVGVSIEDGATEWAPEQAFDPATGQTVAPPPQPALQPAGDPGAGAGGSVGASVPSPFAGIDLFPGEQITSSFAGPTEGAWSSDFGGGGYDLGSGGADVGAGAGADPSKFGGADVAPAGISDPLAFQAGGFNISPSNIGGSFVGNWLGNQLVKGGGQEGDPQDAWMQSVGSTIGAAIGSLIPIPFVGSAFGSMMGNIAGAAFMGQPDVPYSYAYGGGNYDWNNPNAAPTFSIGGAGAMNNGNASRGGGVGDALQSYLNDRAAAEGYVWNPEKVNQGGFYTGVWGGNNAGTKQQMFYQPYYDYRGGEAVLRDGREEPDMLFNTFGDLADTVWGDQVSHNYWSRPGTTASWGDVLGNLNSDATTQRWTAPTAGYSEANGYYDNGPNVTAVNQRFYQPEGRDAFSGAPSWVGPLAGNVAPIQYGNDFEAGGAGAVGGQNTAGWWGSVAAGGDGATQQQFFEGSPFAPQQSPFGDGMSGLTQETMDAMMANASANGASNG